MLRRYKYECRANGIAFCSQLAPVRLRLKWNEDLRAFQRIISFRGYDYPVDLPVPAGLNKLDMDRIFAEGAAEQDRQFAVVCHNGDAADALCLSKQSA